MLNSQNGSATVEFAIIAPLLFLLLFGIIDFGVLLYNQAVITNACREGARFGIVARSPSRTPSEIQTVVINSSVPNLIDFGASSTPSVSAVPLSGTTNFGDDLAVQVQWNHTFMIVPNLSALFGDALSNPLTISSRTMMKYE
jgi:Flp pilus assembly protein TadG